MAEFGRILLGLVGIVLGVLGYRYSYHIARVSEQLDAIGSTTPMDEVEPAIWKELLTRIGFLIAAALGVFVTISGVF